MREHIANAAGQIARVAVLTLPVLACDGQPAAGGYRWPEAMIGIALDADAQTETTEALTAYAAEHGLHRYRVVEDPVANKAKRENPLFQRETSYNPSPANSPYGFSFILSKLSPECWTIRFFERFPTWSQESVSAFNSLVDHLQSVTRTQVFVYPKLGEGRDDARTSRPLEALCPLMGLPEPPRVEYKSQS
jgi:hypothetical protein